MKKNESQNLLYKRDNESDKANYIKSLYAQEDDVLKATTQSIVVNNFRPINLGAEEARLVQILLKLHNSKTVIEIGTLVGYSTIWIARALPAGGRVISFEKDEKVAAVARENISKSDVANRIEVIVGDAHEKLKDIKNRGPFDAMFIDAEKGGYCKYLDWAEKNIRSGGLILADNTFMFGLAYDDGLPSGKYTKEVPVMKEFNIRISDKNKYDGIIIPTVEGLTVAIKKF